ncbi:MAG: hypothetical protein COV09_01070, partial [Candidatus Vogelbacteria bacterium CG10_big_fil_rev_8_21_14_0_10_50_13]
MFSAGSISKAQPLSRSLLAGLLVAFLFLSQAGRVMAEADEDTPPSEPPPVEELSETTVIETGDAVAESTVVNEINTTEIETESASSTPLVESVATTTATSTSSDQSLAGGE